MRKVSIVAIIACVAGLAGVGPSVAGGTGMGDPSAHMRYMQQICDEQKRGEYPRYHEACLPDELGPPPAHR